MGYVLDDPYANCHHLTYQEGWMCTIMDQRGKTNTTQNHVNKNTTTGIFPTKNDVNNASINNKPCANETCNNACDNVYVQGYAIGYYAGLAYADGYHISYMTAINDNHTANLVPGNDDTNR